MGYEAQCTLEWGARRSEGKAQLELDDLIFRGDFRLRIPLKAITAVHAEGGKLAVTSPEGRTVFTLGPAAEKWAERIRSPKGLLDKLDIKPGMRVSVIGVEDAAFLEQLAARTGNVTRGEAAAPESDAIIYGVERKEQLAALKSLRAAMKPAGALWVVHPKGVREVADTVIFTAAAAVGLTYTKVARFSDTHTAEKLVVPVAQR